MSSRCHPAALSIRANCHFFKSSETVGLHSAAVGMSRLLVYGVCLFDSAILPAGVLTHFRLEIANINYNGKKVLKIYFNYFYVSYNFHVTVHSIDDNCDMFS